MRGGARRLLTAGGEEGAYRAATPKGGRRPGAIAQGRFSLQARRSRRRRWRESRVPATAPSPEPWTAAAESSPPSPPRKRGGGGGAVPSAARSAGRRLHPPLFFVPRAGRRRLGSAGAERLRGKRRLHFKVRPPRGGGGDDWALLGWPGRGSALRRSFLPSRSP